MTKISQLSDIGGSLAAGDEFVIRDVSDISTPNKKVTASGFIDYVIAQGVGSGFTQISAGATAPASVRCFSSGTTREVIVTTSGVERARFLTDGTLRLLNSPGIDFSQIQVNAAGMTSETLDGYEEGTWTPVLRGSTTAGTYELSRAIGIYTKVGRQVTLTMAIQLAGTITGGGTGYAQITGLPFQQVANSYPNGICATFGVDISTNYTTLVFAPVTQAGTTTWFLQEIGDNVAPNDLPIAAFSASDQVFVTFIYIV